MNARALWLGCALLAMAAYAFLVSPREREIADARAHAAMLYDGAAVNEQHIRAAARLHDVQSRVIADVRTLAGQSTGSALTAATLRLLSNEGGRFAVRVTSIAPDAPRSAGAEKSDPLIGTPATIGLNGHFRDIVAFLADVSRHEVLIAIDDVSLGTDSGNGTSGSPLLSVTVHATFYRLRPTALTEIDHAAPN